MLNPIDVENATNEELKEVLTKEGFEELTDNKGDDEATPKPAKYKRQKGGK